MAWRWLARSLFIFAPTVHWDHFYDYVAVPKHGRDIVAALLEQFSEYKIIFRPHPHTVDTPEVRKIAEAFKGYPQFEFDTNASFYMENYARSQLMITDMSGTAFTYAFTTSRPVVFFSHKVHNFRSFYKEQSMVPVLELYWNRLFFSVKFIVDRYPP